MTHIFPDTLFADHRYAVLGLGRNGTPAAIALAQMGASVQAWDDSEQARNGLLALIARQPVDIQNRLTLAPPETFDGFSALVLSPGIPHILPAPHPAAARARAAGIPVLSDAELLFQAVRKAGSKARFAGITGTNGKSTTTTLLAYILEQAGMPVAAGGNLGPAALSLPLLPDNGVYVLEMSSYMLERLDSMHFDVACLLNLTPDHLDRHDGMSGYTEAKKQIFKGQTQNDLAVVGIEDNFCRAVIDELRTKNCNCITISGNPDEPQADIFAEGKILRRKAEKLASAGPALPGSHNAQNAAAAWAMAEFLGINPDVIRQCLSSFAGLPHRQKIVVQHQGVTFIDDSKATNADATARALDCYENLIWIAGGIAKEGGIDSLSSYFPRIRHAFLIGRDAEKLAETLRAHQVPFTVAGTLDKAVPAAFAEAKSSQTPVVLLSPACASFDQFSGFEARGLYFQQLAQALTNPSVSQPGESI